MGRKREERRRGIVRLGADVEEVRELDAAGFDQREERLDDADEAGGAAREAGDMGFVEAGEALP
jgi:hypothetical protein